MARPLPPPPQDPEERRAAFVRVLSIGCGGIGGLVFLLAISLAIFTEIKNPVALTIAACVALLPVPTYVFLVLQLDRYEHEPWLVLVAAFVWGACVATLVALIFNDLFGLALSSVLGERIGGMLTAAAVAPIVEESAKGVALLLLLMLVRREFDNTLDGIVYGSLIGIGFAMTENVLYFGREYLRDGVIGVGLLFYVRVVLGGLGHALYTGTTGAAVGYTREIQHHWLGLLIVPFGWACAVLQHATWNTVGATIVPALLPEDVNPFVLLFVVMPLTTFILSAPGFFALLVIALLAGRREANVIRQYLFDEVARGAVLPEEYDVLPSWKRRAGLEWRTLRQRGFRAFFRRRDFHQIATELAFLKWHKSRGETPKRAQRRTTEDKYRDQLQILRARLA
jgi:RsiW-degrading membrane proteinase PrsW (M82 family)